MRSKIASHPVGASKVLSAVLLASLAAGCSSDSLRFQDGFYTGTDRLSTASVPQPQGNVGNAALAPAASAVPAGGYPAAGSAPQQQFPGDVARYNGAPAVQRGDLASPALAPAQAPTDTMATGTTPPVAPQQAAAPRAPGWSTEGGARVAIGQGETIASIARRYGVPEAEIVKANGLASASAVQAGQQIVIPSYARAGQPAQLAAQPATLNQQAASIAAPAASGASGTYTVQSGDTLNRVANRTGTTVAALRQANGLTGDNIRIGQTLRVPGGAAPQTVAATAPAASPAQTDSQTTASVNAAPAPTTVAAAPAQPAPAAPAEGPAGYTPPAASQSIDEQVGNDVAAIAPQSTGIGKLRWPARGQIVTAFGAQDGNVRNDGIDISVPEGTPVKAAENGVVIYAGSGLKEYGNTVLVRHDNGLVTVYGHARELLVNRGDKVTRGQTIANSGMSGAAQQPKLHFEVRENATPVNPARFLE
jgi:murein DD-endopeptidase MepM/ murein hydrolase activator NlpD